MDEENYQIMKQREGKKNSRTNTRMIQGVHNYDVLSNPDLVDRFIYVPCVLRTNNRSVIDRYRKQGLIYPTSHSIITKPKDADKAIAYVDLIRLVTDLAYLDTSKADRLNINPNFVNANYTSREKP